MMAEEPVEAWEREVRLHRQGHVSHRRRTHSTWRAVMQARSHVVTHG
jgi:hypothetical protein